MDLLIFIFIAFIIINIQWNYVEGKSGFGLTPVWGICDAQCEAYCMELENDCEGKCSRNSLANEWVIHCLQPSIDCLVGSCSNFGFQEEGYIPQVPSISATRDHTDAIIKWDTDTVSSYVIYIIQQSWIGDDDWKTMGLSIHPNYTVSVGCRSPFIRVASVSKYGSRFFCNPIKVPDLKIRNVENITASYIYYDNMTDEVKLLLKWDPPLDWNNSNVDSYKWIPRPIIKGCPVLSFYQRQSLKVFFDYGSKLNDLSVLARIPGYAKNCQLTLQVIAILDCSSDYLQAGPTANFTIDCLIIDGYMCPPVPYNPPGNVEHVKVMLIPGQQTPHVRILWSAPTDLGSSKIIAEYWIAWGILDMNPAHTLFGSPQNLLDIQNMTVPGNQLFAEFDLTSNFTDKTMGMQIMACGPGHSVPKNGWVSPVFNIPSTADILRGQLLTSDDGFIIVKIPNIPSVRVYWRLTNNRSNVRSYKFRWGIYRDMVRSWLLQIDEDISPENTTELFMNATYLDIHHLKINETYWIEYMEVYNNTLDDDNISSERLWDNANVYLFTVPPQVISETSAETPPAIPTGIDKNNILNKTQTKGYYVTLEAVLPLSVLAILAVIIGVVILRKFKKKNLQYLERNPTIDNESFYYQAGNGPTTAIIDLITPAVVADKWELPHSCLKLGSVLGEGAFGQVRIGYITSTMLAHREVLVPFQQDNTSLHVTVAIKLLQDDSECRYKNEFLREINLMKELGLHQNIVSIVGCCTLRDPICLVVEHVPNGDLLAHLKCIRHRLTAECSLGSDYENTQRESLDGFDILSFSRQIAMGMEFLSEKGYVHRDLAARNILIGENNLLKIGDFGLARYIYDDKIYINRKGGKLPLKWMSVEAIFELAFSTASDVWSFGVVLFEIVTFGGTPYPTIPNKDLLQELSHGYRMEKPDNCSQQLYDIMMVCWNENPRDRPSFTDLRQQFEEMMEGSSGVPYLQLNFNLHSEYYRSEVQESVSRETIDGASTPANMDDTSSVVSSCSTSNKRGMSVKERICGKKDVTQLHMQHIDVRTVSNSSERLKMRRHCDSTVDDVFSEVVEFELIPLRDSQSKQLGELLRCDDLSSSASSSSSSCDLLLHPARLVSASSTDSAFPASPLCLRASGIADNEIDTDDALSSRNWFWGTSEETSNTLSRSKSLTLPRLTLSHEVIRSVMTFDIENDLPKLRSKRISSDHSNSSKDSALPRSPNLDMDIGPHYDLAEGFADSGV